MGPRLPFRNFRAPWWAPKALVKLSFQGTNVIGTWVAACVRLLSDPTTCPGRGSMTEERLPRRSFLTTAAASVAGTALGIAATPSLARAGAANRDDARGSALAPVHEIKLGIASYSLR